MTGPLEGVRVLDLTRVLAGPYCTMVLGDLGAEVLKVEIPGVGDDAREFGPFVEGESAYFASVNRNKASITLDLKEPEGAAVLADLVETADVLVENFRPGTLAKLGFDEDRLDELNPELVYAALSGYGRAGPDSDKPCYDAIAQARSGLVSITGPDPEHPTKVGTSISDISSGLFTTIGILAALYARDDVGGQTVDVAMLDSTVALLENAVVRCVAEGRPPEPIGNRHPSIVPFESFETADGDVVVAAGNDQLWEALCAAIDRPELADDPRFESNRARNENYDELRPLLASAFEERPTDEWMAILDEAGLPNYRINDVGDVLEDDQLRARGMFAEVGLPGGGHVTVPDSPVNLSESSAGVEAAAPALGADTERVLTEDLGYAPEEVEALREQGVI
jgi:CoA:oxalate CoA-transferase